MSVGADSFKLPEKYWPAVLKVLDQIHDDGNIDIEILSAGAGRVFDRKGYLSVDLLGNERTRSYTSDSDDFILTITVRVPNWDNAAKALFTPLEDTILEDRELDLAVAVENAQDGLNLAQARLNAVQARRKEINP